MGKGDIRDISPFLQKIRNFLLGRDHVYNNRFQVDVATRSPPPPNLPDGPSHVIHSNYYYQRDVRREVQLPQVVAAHHQLLTEEKLKEKTELSKVEKSYQISTPGNVYHWD